MRHSSLLTLWLMPGAIACHAAAGPPATVVTSEEAAASRAACKFTAGMQPADTLASTDPVGSQIPIDHVVLVMQENRSFDAYFSHLTVPGQTIEAAADDATNPDAQGKPVSRFHWSAATATNDKSAGKDYYCFASTDHGWDQTHAEYDNGALDGFVTTNADTGNGNRAMGYYDESDIPYYYALARAFAMSDAHFCSLLGPTWPNRMFYFAGTSFGLTYNRLPPDMDSSGNPYPNLFSELSRANVDWKVYFVDIASPIIFADTYGKYTQNFVPLAQYYTDAQNGQLPSVAVVEGSDSGRGSAIDEHPPQDVQVGEAFVAGVIQALMTSPNWPKSALFLTYDEHGGQYDHVKPVPACPPDNLPQLPANDPVKAGFDMTGFRTPLFAISPYAKRGYVSHVAVDHTSILKFVETRFDLPVMTGRDANAWPLLDMFDFSHPDVSVPMLPDAPIDPEQQAQCLTDYPPSASSF